MLHPDSPRPCRPALRAGLWRTGLALLLVTPAAFAQDADAAGFNQLDWTGLPASPVTARKEAGAALVEGRRECARRRDGRAACLKQVQDDYAASLKRLQTGKPRR